LPMCPLAGSTNLLIYSPSKANSTALCTVFVLCQLLITKLSVIIYILNLYKQTSVSIDVITQPMQVRHNLLRDCFQKIVILVDFTVTKNYICKKGHIIWSVAAVSCQVSYFMFSY
jgi:hypothetical protein